jgi:hypothetical protein
MFSVLSVPLIPVTPIVETVFMSESSDKVASRQAEKKTQPFLDCIAHLMAKRWLRDQRQQNEEPTQQEKQDTLEPEQ